MLTFKDYTENFTCFTYTLLKFKSQTQVVYDTHVMSIRLSKSDLIVCIKYILFRLSQLGYLDKVKHGFVLDTFKYFELSVYLHGLCQVYSGLINMPPVGELHINRSSRLPHDVIKPEKQTKLIHVSCIEDSDIDGSFYYFCVIAGVPLCAYTSEGLIKRISTVFSGYAKQYEFVFDVK